MSVVAVPTLSTRSKWRRWVIATVVALAAMALFWLLAPAGPDGAAGASGIFQRVALVDLNVSITKDGELQAINNVEIVCPVEGQQTLQSVIKEGSSVKKGDVLIVLDASTIRRSIEETTLEVQKAEAGLTTARDQEEIQKSQNTANLQEAEVAFELAKVDLREYLEGTYPQEVAESKNTLEMAKITLKNREEDLANARNLFQKGFITAADVKTAEYDVIWARNDVEKNETKIKVLTEYTYQKNITDKNNKVAQAEKKLERVKRENASNLSQKVADVVAKQQGLELQKYRLDRLKDQLEKCVIRSPADGMVVYPSENYGRGSGQNPLQEGAKVVEQQLLLRLPDTRSMKAVIRINESQVSNLRMDPENPMRATVKIVGYPEPIGATVSKISVMADGNQRWWNPDLKEYPVDLTLDVTPVNMKPGMSVQAQIFLNRLENVLAAPLNAIYSAGKETYVFLPGGDNPRPVKVRIGATNETHAQILEGISAGQDVLLLQTGQGAELLDKAGIKSSAPTSRPAREGDNASPEKPAAPPQ